MTPRPRWQATVVYRSELGLVDLVHDITEIADLHALVENGPHFDTVARIEIARINHIVGEHLTVEQAERM